MYLVIQSVTDMGRKINDLAYHELPIAGVNNLNLANGNTGPRSIIEIQKTLPNDSTEKAINRITSYPSNLYFSVKEYLK